MISFKISYILFLFCKTGSIKQAFPEFCESLEFGRTEFKLGRTWGLGLEVCLRVWVGVPSRTGYGPLRGPTSSFCGGLWPLAEGFFLPFGEKKNLIRMFWPILGHFWCPVVTLLTFKKNRRSQKKL